MRRFAEEWRKFADKRKTAAAKGEQLFPLPPKEKEPSGAPHPLSAELKAKKPPQKSLVFKPVVKEDHNQFRTVLPKDVNEIHCYDKHLALVHEAKRIDMVDNPYAGLAIIRMIFETSAVTFTERHSKFVDLKTFAIDKRNKASKQPMSAEAEKKLIPAIDDMLAYFEANQSIWGSAKENYVRHSVKRMGKYQSTINGVIHSAYQQVSKALAIQIRDEVLPILRHLIEK